MKKEWSLIRALDVSSKFRMLKTSLKEWNKVVFGNIDESIHRLEVEMGKLDKKCEHGDFDEVEEARKVALYSCLEKWYVRKEMYWR